jgi:hypothetical protein
MMVDGEDQHAPEAGIGEHRFHHDDTAHQDADIDRQHRDCRQDGVRQGVPA